MSTLGLNPFFPGLLHQDIKIWTDRQNQYFSIAVRTYLHNPQFEIFKLQIQIKAFFTLNFKNEKARILAKYKGVLSADTPGSF